MKKLFRNILNQFLGHTTDGYFRVPDTAQDLPNPKNDTPWAGTLKLSMDKFNKLTRKDGHGSPGFYAIIGIVLAAITLVEFLIFYVESLGVLLIPIMLVLSLMKFVIVVAFFMHLRFDNRVFTIVFFAGFVLAVVIAIILLLVFAIKPVFS
tara:strand:- start:2609 stop:3061 length:453 start_codon:yes stop_codon:yes gene_type:complete